MMLTLINISKEIPGLFKIIKGVLKKYVYGSLRNYNIFLGEGHKLPLFNWIVDEQNTAMPKICTSFLAENLQVKIVPFESDSLWVCFHSHQLWVHFWKWSTLSSLMGFTQFKQISK